MADINSQLPAKLTDGTLTATIRNTGSDDSLNVAIVDASGNQITSFGGGTEYDIQDVQGATDTGGVALVVRNDTLADLSGGDGAYAPIQVTATGALWVHDINSTAILADTAAMVVDLAAIEALLITIDSDTNTIQGDTTNILADTTAILSDTTAILSDTTGILADTAAMVIDLAAIEALLITIDSDTSDIAVDTGTIASDTTAILADTANIDTATAAINAKMVSGTDIGDVTVNNTESTPVPVYITGGALSGSEIHDYDTATPAGAASDNHDYTVAGTTFLLKELTFAASGRMKIELLTGPVAALVAKGVWFISTANPSYTITFAQPIDVPDTSTGTVRVIRTNLETAAMDVYSTIIGNDLA